MSTNGDHEMADATAGADIDAPVRAEKQRLRLVRPPVRALADTETNEETAPWIVRHCSFIRFREGRSYSWKRPAIHHHEEVRFASYNRQASEHALTYRHSPDVEFCGYSIPHPSEAVLHLRIQTWGELYMFNRNITSPAANKPQTTSAPPKFCAKVSRT